MFHEFRLTFLRQGGNGSSRSVTLQRTAGHGQLNHLRERDAASCPATADRIPVTVFRFPLKAT